MFSNIPINLLSETQLGVCTALSCVLGRRGGGGVELTSCSNKEEIERVVVLHTRSHMWTHATAQYIVGLVGLCVFAASVHGEAAQTH